MKSFLTALVIAALLLAASEVYMVKLNKATEELSGINNNIMAAINADDYNTARSEIERFSKRLEQKHMFFAAMGNHAEMDNIEMSLSELKSYSEGEQKFDALAKSYTLAYLLGHLPENMKLRIENIL